MHRQIWDNYFKCFSPLLLHRPIHCMVNTCLIYICSCAKYHLKWANLAWHGFYYFLASCHLESKEQRGELAQGTEGAEVVVDEQLWAALSRGPLTPSRSPSVSRAHRGEALPLGSALWTSLHWRGWEGSAGTCRVHVVPTHDARGHTAASQHRPDTLLQGGAFSRRSSRSSTVKEQSQ